jgi:D-alanyl-lipoteichoic acid acyltransferase DltB (MBOAT superfamily)
VPAKRDLLRYALYVTFFPQLVAGPIERAGHMLPQCRASSFDAEVGATRSADALGFFKKVVIADKHRDYCEQDLCSFLAHFPGALGRGAGIHGPDLCRLFRYTDIARGTRALLGIELMRNFNHPYLRNFTSGFLAALAHVAFDWMRDYIYIPARGVAAVRRGTPFNPGCDILQSAASGMVPRGTSSCGAFTGDSCFFERMLDNCAGKKDAVDCEGHLYLCPRLHWLADVP